MTFATTVDAALRSRIVEAYDVEIGFLDRHDLVGWSSWLEPDFRYEVPIPLVRDDYSRPQHSERGFLAVETKPSIDLWIQRLQGKLVEHAFAENPAPRYRHFISGIRIIDGDDHEAVQVSSNVMLTWTRHEAEPDLMTGERRDVLAVRNGGVRLRRRIVLLDSVRVHFNHLRVIF